MLKLDKKKIRKGKAVGLPYVGSKKKISKKIIEIIKQNFDIDGKTVYDIFGGGGAVTAECLINNIPVVYNDLDKSITDIFDKVLHENREWIKTMIISRSEFIEIKEKDNKTIEDELKLLVNSFGNNSKGYLYSKEYSDLKYELAIEIIKKHDCFSGYKQTGTYKNAHKPYFEGKKEKAKTLQRLQQLEQLEQLQRLEQLEQMQQLECRFKTTNNSYECFSNLKGQVLYLDPPYENSNQEAYKGNFNSDKFYNWAYEMSQNNIVIISSYEISDDRFECVFEFRTARCTLAGGSKGRRTEKLFMAKHNVSDFNL